MLGLIGFAILCNLPQSGAIDHVFELQLPNRATSVSVAGTFNNWNKDADPMASSADGKVWRKLSRLAPGRYQYKFVIDGSNWVVDPKAKKNEDDGNGNVNSILTLLPADYAKPAKAGDGIIAKSALRHDRSLPNLNWDRGRLSITFQCRPGDLSHLELFLEDPKGEKCIELREVARDDFSATYRCEFDWNRKADVRYRFMVVDGPTRLYFTPSGLSEKAGSPFVIKSKGFKPFITPSWVESTVFYQIFPDRFANGSMQNDPAGVEPWDGKPTYYNRFGGDAAGIGSRVEYLRNLGVSGIYFNPVFKSPSNHRYDASDYMLVDPEIGTNQEFFDLTKKLKAAGIRTMMDFAFNHTATDFGPFLDLRTNGPESKFKNWYWVKEYPVVVKENPPYVAWFNFPSMPKLNVMNPATHEYVLKVVDFWKKNASLDGLRLDVANEVDMQMWRDLRTHVKAYAPDTYILGEEWGNASRWLQGDQWDASMNYGFRDACLRYFAEQKIRASEFAQRLFANYSLYAPQVSRNQYNLLSSHDTPRFLTLCSGDQAMANLAATVLLTWVGTPSIYYGEEIGMQGGADPENRRGMEWNRVTSEEPVLSFYRKMIAIRQSSRALQSGEPIFLTANDQEDTLAFARVSPDEQAIVALNRSSSARTFQVSLPHQIASRRFVDAMTGGKISVTGNRLRLTVPTKSAVILRSIRSSSRPRGTASKHPARYLSTSPSLEGIWRNS